MRRSAAWFLLAILSLMPLAGRPAAEPAGERPRSRTYVLVMLWRASDGVPQRSPELDSLQAGHLANMNRRYEEGWLIGAGPILDPGSRLRGLFFFAADSVSEVVPLVATDPMIAARRLSAELTRWAGNPGVGDDYERAKAARPGRPDSMVRYVVGLPLPARPGNAADPAHLEYVQRLAHERRAILWGPFLDGEPGRELIVYATPDTAEARRWADGDPGVKAGRRRVELRPWLVAHGVVPGH